MRWRIVALIVGVLLVLTLSLRVTPVGPIQALEILVKGSLGRATSLTETVRNTTPLLIAGVAVFLALRAGLFNIGAEGQLLVGALACTVVALKVPGIGGMLLGTLAAIVAGSLWAWPAGAIRAYRNGHEVITTIMLNNVAGLLTGYFVSNPPLRAPGGDTTTATIADATRIPNVLHIGSFTLSLAVPIGIAMAAVLAWWLKRTVAGYELRAVGANPTAARFAGIDAKRTIVKTMVASGAIAGFAGAVQVLAYEGRFYNGFSPGYGFDALGVALLAGESALALMPAAFLFGMLAKGSGALQIEGVPKGLTTGVLALVILVAAALRSQGVKKVA